MEYRPPNLLNLSLSASCSIAVQSVACQVTKILRQHRGCSVAFLIAHLERRAVFRPCPTMIVNARRGDIGMSKPLLHLCNVGLVIERVRGSGGAQRMRADLKTERGRVGPHQ